MHLLLFLEGISVAIPCLFCALGQVFSNVFMPRTLNMMTLLKYINLNV